MDFSTKDFANFTKHFSKDFNKDLARVARDQRARKRPMQGQFSKFMGKTGKRKKYGFGSVAAR